MSLLPFTATNAVPRERSTNPSDRAPDLSNGSRPRAAIRPVRPERAERTPYSERQDATTRDEPTTRSTTPPDFAALMALLAVSSVRDAQAQRALLGTGSADEAPPELEGQVVDEETAALSAEADPGELATPDPDERSVAAPLPRDLLRTLPSSASDRAREVLAALDASANRSSFGNDRLFTTSASTTDASSAAFAALADRVRTGNAGELLARGDRAAAGVRGALDALLDVAGTARGRALAESVRPAFAEAVTRSAGDVNTAVRDADALAPAFRARLDRVIDRMRDEFGHDVQVVETVRSSERQEHLYAQGRTRPGPVVTWTLDSAHLSGEAADVIIDGQWHNPQGYTRLHVIAQEEGLRTLGMRDPGHLELRGSASHGEHAAALNGEGVAANTRTSTDATRAATIASTGGVAAVARVASVARVAQVAQVARVGSSGLARDTRAPATSTPDTVPGATVRTAALASATARQGDQHGGGTSRDSRDAESRPVRASALDNLSAVGALSPTATRILDGDTLKVTMPVGSDSASRAEAIAVLREDAPVRALSSLTMQLDSPDGPEQVRVTLRGGVVDTQVTTSSGALADRLRMQTADLQDALGRHGLDTEKVKVQQTARVHDGDAVRQALSDRGETLRAAGASAGQQGGSFEQAPRDRQPARPNAEREPRQAHDDSPQQRRRDNRQEQR